MKKYNRASLPEESVEVLALNTRNRINDVNKYYIKPHRSAEKVCSNINHIFNIMIIDTIKQIKDGNDVEISLSETQTKFTKHYERLYGNLCYLSRNDYDVVVSLLFKVLVALDEEKNWVVIPNKYQKFDIPFFEYFKLPMLNESDMEKYMGKHATIKDEEFNYDMLVFALIKKFSFCYMK